VKVVFLAHLTPESRPIGKQSGSERGLHVERMSFTATNLREGPFESADPCLKVKRGGAQLRDFAVSTPHKEERCGPVPINLSTMLQPTYDRSISTCSSRQRQFEICETGMCISSAQAWCPRIHSRWPYLPLSPIVDQRSR
jgi:hypothetical protein